ncbi:MAG: hypothetical protein KDK05_19785 [Candidatus Competibacteraceae bacterium]|nr:hypothetical protein [Candidatus Competibacteraceae bacterium]
MTVNPAGGEILVQGDRVVRRERAVELNEQWSFVGCKANPRGLWYALDHATNTILAYYVFGRRKDPVLTELKVLLSAFNTRRYQNPRG